jgi:hypothetical protein
MKKKSTERRVYTKEFMAEAVALAEKREKPIKFLLGAPYPRRRGGH